MPITVNDGLKINAPRAVDLKYGRIIGGRTVPYMNRAEALATVISSFRHVGLTVNISGEEWWWKADITDDGLVRKFPEGTIAIFTVKAEDVGMLGKSIPVLEGYRFFMRRDTMPMKIDIDYTIYSGGGFEMINNDDVFALNQTFELIIMTNLIVI